MRYVTEPKVSEENKKDYKAAVESTEIVQKVQKYPTMNVRLLTEDFYDSNKNPICPIGLFVVPEKVNFGMDGHEPYKGKEYVNFRIQSVSQKFEWACSPMQQSE